MKHQVSWPFLLPLEENPVCSSVPPAHGCSMGLLQRRGTNPEHQAELPSSPFPLAWLQSARTGCDDEEGKPLPQKARCKPMMREETPETEEMGKDSSTRTSWQIGWYNWENK